MRRSSYGPPLSASSSGGRRLAASPSWASGFWSNEKMKYDFGLTSPSRLSRERGVVECDAGAEEVLLQHGLGRDVREALHQLLDEGGARPGSSGAHDCNVSARRWSLPRGSDFVRISGPVRGLGYPRPGVVMRRLLTILLLLGAFAAPAQAAGPVTLMPGVTYEKTVQFTPHGAVVVHVLKAPRPGDQNGLYQLAPVLARNSVLGGQAARDADGEGPLGDRDRRGHQRRSLQRRRRSPERHLHDRRRAAHPPLSARSSIGIDTAGALHVDRVKFFGTWKGTGQRRPLAGINQTPAPGQVELFTPAYGARDAPDRERGRRSSCSRSRRPRRTST